MKVIDWEQKGHLIRFYLGADDLKTWWGDDWDDAPYEHNAGRVYEEYIAGYKDVCLEWDKESFDPSTNYSNSPYTKEDMVARKVPCIVVTDRFDDSWKVSIKTAEKIIGANVFYFGDKMEADVEYKTRV